MPPACTAATRASASGSDTDRTTPVAAVAPSPPARGRSVTDTRDSTSRVPAVPLGVGLLEVGLLGVGLPARPSGVT